MQNIPHSVIAMVDYVPGVAPSASIVEKMTGSVVVVAFDRYKTPYEKVLPFDRFIMVLDGTA